VGVSEYYTVCLSECLQWFIIFVQKVILVHGSWLQIQRSRVRFPALQIFWEVMGPERSPLSLMSTIEVLLGRNNGGSSLENKEYSHGDPLRWPHDTLYPQKLALTSPTSGGRLVGIVRLRTTATEFVHSCYILLWFFTAEVQQTTNLWLSINISSQNMPGMTQAQQYR
jgi:hypothetical protein